MKFSGSSEELTQEERFALFDLPLDIEDESQVEEETSAPDTVAAEEPTEEPEESVEGQPELAPEAADVEALAPGEAATSEEEEVSTETAAEVVAELGPDETWKQRYDDLRRSEMAALEKERRRAADAEEALAQALASRQQPKISEEALAALATEAEAAGLEPEQIAVLAKIMEAATPQDDTMVNYLAREAEDARNNAAQTLVEHEQQTLAAFQADHPDLAPEQMVETARIMYDIGAAEFFDANGQQLPDAMPYEVKLRAVQDGQAVYQSWPPNEPLDRFILEVAYEAVRNPDLGVVLRANPEYAQTETGLAYAREQASLRAAQRAVTTLPPAKTAEEIDATLAAAETLGGTSGAEPVKQVNEVYREREPVHFSK